MRGVWRFEAKQIAFSTFLISPLWFQENQACFLVLLSVADYVLISFLILLKEVSVTPRYVAMCFNGAYLIIWGDFFRSCRYLSLALRVIIPVDFSLRSTNCCAIQALPHSLKLGML